MAVYFAPQKQPWWAGILGQLAVDQIGAMMERTKEAKQVEAQRAFGEFLSGLDPNADSSEVLRQSFAHPQYGRAGDVGQKSLDRAMADRERRRAEMDMSGLNGDVLDVMRPLHVGNRLGMDQDVLAKTLFPQLVQRNVNLGDRFVGQMVNPRTGKVTGDGILEQIGMDPGKAAELAQKEKQFNAEMWLKRQVAAQGGGGDGTRGWTLKQDKDGNYVYFHPTYGAKPLGVPGPVSGDDRIEPADLVKALSAFGGASEEDEAMRAQFGSMLMQMLTPSSGAPSGGAPATGRAAGGVGVPERIRVLSAMPPQDVLQDPGAIRELASYMGVTEDEVRRKLQDGAGR